METTRPTRPHPPTSVDRRPAVTVLAGFSPAATEAVARVLMVTELTDAELGGSTAWTALPDPFAGCFPPPDDDPPTGGPREQPAA